MPRLVPTDTPSPALERHRRYVAKLRADLTALIGEACVQCGATEDLTCDHLGPREWSGRKTWSHQRLKKHIEEAKAGLLQVLCRSCNSRKGRPNPDEPDDWLNT